MSSRFWWWLTPALAVVGVVVAGYLTYAHYEHDALVCGLGDCTLVQTSTYATLLGIPIAILGLVMYVAILGMSLGRMRLPRHADVLDACIFGLALAGVIYAAFLTYVEIWVIEAICQWCVVSALVTTAILVVEFRTLFLSEPEGHS